RRDIVAVVPVFHQSCAATLIFGVGETRNEHASGQRICAMRPDGTAGSLGEIVDRLRQLRFRRIGVDIEDENAAAFEAGEPELAAIVGEPTVMRLVAPVDRNAVDDFAVAGRTGFYIDGDELVHAIAHTFDAERPNVNELLLAFDAGKVR